MPKTREQKLFGAACLKLALESSSGKDPARLELYQGALTDLGVTDAEVERYLAGHRDEVARALETHRKSKS